MSLPEYKGINPPGTEPYIPDPYLKEAVNIAITLKRPLLLKGEPGCGKTKLARAVADELNLTYFEWPVRSTSRAQDGLYTYDTIGRLRDAQLAGNLKLGKTEREAIDARFKKKEAYVNYGPLGKGLQKEFHKDDKGTKQAGAIVLIDEIDKADIDFPNDLLHVLEEKSFTVGETTPPININADTDQPPLIFITSNDEKELPDAFLRRCIFYYIEFPNEETLRNIVSLHIQHDLKKKELDPKLQTFIDDAVEKFGILRKTMEDDKKYGGKKASTSELIDWVRVFKNRYYDQGEDLFPTTNELLFPSVLLKSLADQMKYAPKKQTTEPRSDSGVAAE